MNEELRYVFDRLEEEEKIISFYKTKKKENQKKIIKNNEIMGMRFSILKFFFLFKKKVQL